MPIYESLYGGQGIGKSIVCDKRTHLHAGHNTCIAVLKALVLVLNVAVLHKGNREDFRF